MSRILVAIVAAGIAFASTTGFAADAAKSTELTKEERADMRSRAERLTAQRAQAPADHAQMPAHSDTAVGTTHKAHKSTKTRTTKAVATKHGAKAGSTKHVATKPATTKSGAKKPGKGTTPAVKAVEPKA